MSISTSKLVLHMPFAGRNQFFDAKTTFCVLFSNKMYKIMQKNNKNHVLKGVYQRLGVTLNLFCSVSDGKSCFSVRKSILTS